MSDIPPGPRDALFARALELHAEAERFAARWPPLEDSEPCLKFSWAELERQLVEMAPTDLQAELVRRLLARAKAFAALRPTEMVLRELLGTIALVLDENPPEPPRRAP